jgi:hypothetical protein
VACAASACGGGRRDAKPVAMLASSPESAAAFEAIREAFADPEHTTAAALRNRVERFVAQYPQDGLVPRARVILALVAMRTGDLAAADAELAGTAGGPRGTTEELWTVARARRLRLGGDPEAGLVLLRPLVGKSVDPLARATFEEELTLTALATHRDYEAISYMDAWLRASSPEEKPATIAQVTAAVQRLPREALVGSLQAMSTQRVTLGYGVDIERILAQRLVQIATTSGDAQLARMLLEADPQAFTTAGDAGTELGELAASRLGLNVVEGRTLGLLLPTESPGLRDESADVLRGVLWALGLPRGSRTASPSDAGSPPAPDVPLATCAGLDPAPPIPEPDPEDAVRLVTRDDEGSLARTEVSLDELAGEGAAIVIAGLDGQTAQRALAWGEEHGVPVIALVPPVAHAGAPEATSGAASIPGPQAGRASFGFELGETRARVLEALAKAEPALATGKPAPVIDSSELPFVPQGGPFMKLASPVSCDIPAARAGEPRFPLGDWQHDGKTSWVVSGSPDCAADLIGELTVARTRGVVAMTLEAATVLAPEPGLRIVSARAGLVPETDPHDPRNEELRRFSATLGRAGWWTALGRDAATLARAALLAMPVDAVSEPRAVADRRAVARASLASAHARLWTTESSGWSAGRPWTERSAPWRRPRGEAPSRRQLRAVRVNRREERLERHRLAKRPCKAQRLGRDDRARIGRQHDDGDVCELGVVEQLGPELHAVHPRHHEVEQDDARSLDAGAEPVQRVLAVCGRDHAVALRLQRVREDVADVAIIVDDEHSFAVGRMHF